MLLLTTKLPYARASWTTITEQPPTRTFDGLPRCKGGTGSNRRGLSKNPSRSKYNQEDNNGNPIEDEDARGNVCPQARLGLPAGEGFAGRVGQCRKVAWKGPRGEIFVAERPFFQETPTHSGSTREKLHRMGQGPVTAPWIEEA